MFTLPSRPPRDYKLEDVTETQASAPELTPLAYPRATQTSVAKYCTPIPADDNDPLDSIQAESYNELILNKFINKARADWVDRPESDGFFIHDMCKKYRVDVIPEVDVRFQYHPQIFNRPYMYELDCMEYVRLQKLYDKTRREEDADKNMLERLASLKRKQEAKELVKNPCKKYPPRWWKEPVPEEEWLEFDSKPSQSVYQASYHRWQPVPEISRETDPIKGRYAFAKRANKNFTGLMNGGWVKKILLLSFNNPLVHTSTSLWNRKTVPVFALKNKLGEPFQNEAANWYYKNYPPPNIKYRPEKLS